MLPTSRSSGRNVRLTISYDGTDFHGFAESEGVRTVMGELRRAVETVVRSPVELTGAGRTDSGVHAWGQIVTGLVPEGTDLGRLARSVNGLCAPDIAVREIDWAAPDLSARFSATSRTYRYLVWNHRAPNPLLGRTSWHVPQPLDVTRMNQAAEFLVGDHDFSSFCRRPRPAEGSPDPSLVRRLLTAHWTEAAAATCGPGLLQFEISATSFCHQMVRSIVGTLVDVGLGRRSVDSIPVMLAALDRQAAGQVAPPTGLVLYSVDYSGQRWDA